MEPTVRYMLRKDIPAVGDILFRSFNAVASRHGYAPKFHTKKEGDSWAWALLRHKPVEIIIAEIENRIAGLCCLNPRGDIGGVGPVAVDPEIQGGRIGHRLMRALIEKAEQIGSLRLIQEAYNPASFALYHRLEFIPVACLLEMVSDDCSSTCGETPQNVQVLQMADMDAWQAYDQPKSRSDRRCDMEYYIHWGKVFVYRVQDRIRGFLACLPGPESVTLGPMLADGELEAIVLFQHAIAVFGNKVCRTRIMASDLLLAGKLKEWGFRIHCINNLMVRGTWRPEGFVAGFGIFPEGI